MVRAQRYEKDALEELFNRNLEAVYAIAHALCGDANAAEALAGQAFMKALDGLPSNRSEAARFDTGVRRLAATGGLRRLPMASGVRAGLGRLPRAQYEVVALRLLGGLSTELLASHLGRRPAAVRAQLADGLRELGGGRNGHRQVGAEADFDLAVDRARDGPEAGGPAGSPAVPADADVLLTTAGTVAALARAPIPPATATRLRTMFFAAVGERRALWVHRNHGVATVPGVNVRKRPSQTGAYSALAFAGMLALGIGVVLAVLSSFADPDSVFYPIKGLGESVLIKVNRDPVARADLEIKLAGARSREAEDMAAAGKGQLAEDAIARHFDLLRSGATDLKRAPLRTAKWKAARDRLFDEAGKPQTQEQRDLKAAGQAGAADGIKVLAENYQNQRKSLDAGLGRAVPAAGPAPGSEGTNIAPSPAPSP